MRASISRGENLGPVPAAQRSGTVERVALNALAWSQAVAAATAIRSCGLGASLSTSIPGVSDPSYTQSLVRKKDRVV